MKKSQSLRSLRRAAKKEINAFLDAYTNELFTAMKEHHHFKYSPATRKKIMAPKVKISAPAKKHARKEDRKKMDTMTYRVAQAEQLVYRKNVVLIVRGATRNGELFKRGFLYVRSAERYAAAQNQHANVEVALYHMGDRPDIDEPPVAFNYSKGVDFTQAVMKAAAALPDDPLAVKALAEGLKRGSPDNYATNGK